MLTRLDKIVIWLVTIVVVPGLVFPIAIEAPMFTRCTQSAIDLLSRAEPLDRHPPASLVAILKENLGYSLQLQATRQLTAVSECSGPFTYDIGSRIWSELVLSSWLRLRLRDDLVTLYTTQAYLGHNTYGFAAAARRYYGRELSDLSSEEMRCLVRKTKAPSSPRLACNGQ
jgi:hypothetical protein